MFSHVVNFTRLEIPLHGRYKNQIESDNQVLPVSLAPGAVLFAAPNCWNLPEWQPGLELLSVFFGRTRMGIRLVSSRSEELSAARLREIFAAPARERPGAALLVIALAEAQAENEANPALTDLVRALMLACVENLLRQPAARPGSRAQTLFEEIRVFLQSHYQYEITRDSVAEQFNMTPNHMSRLFRTHGHMTFTGYLTSVRIDRAKHLLRNYNLKLDDIATRCGYHDTPYFWHVFRRLAKCTPIEYRLKERAPKRKDSA